MLQKNEIYNGLFWLPQNTDDKLRGNIKIGNNDLLPICQTQMS